MVEFYGADEPSHNRQVAGFLWEGFLRGDGLLVIATPRRRESIAGNLTKLGADVALARRQGQLSMLDARETLEKILAGEEPDAFRFESVIGEALGAVRSRTPEAGICAYGEMVGVLWEEGRTVAALRLEECWNNLLARGGVELFCGYPVDIFAPEFANPEVRQVVHAHSRTVAAGADGEIASVLSRAIGEILGAGAEALCASAAAENTILELRRSFPEKAEEILVRARSYYSSCQSTDGSVFLVG
jgi:hypothetical protein